MKTLMILLLSVFFLCSCESYDWFQSEGKLKKEIQGTWKREFMTYSDYEEDWVFKDGKITIIHIKTPSDTIDNGNYSIDAKITSAYLKITDLVDSSFSQFNDEWTIVQLDKKVLYLATDYKTGGVVQREFIRK